MYILDTNSIIYFFKGMGNISTNLLKHSPKDIFVPSIVVYELEVGIAKSNAPQKRKEQLNKLLSSVNIINFSKNEAKASADIRAKLELKGTPIGDL